MTFFCPVCFGQSDNSDGNCLQCGTDTQTWSRKHSYTARLMQALQHPISEVRMGAIITLGLRCDTEAASALADCAMTHPADIPEGLETVSSLERLAKAPEGRLSLKKLAAEHSAQAVRAAAEEALRKLPV